MKYDFAIITEAENYKDYAGSSGEVMLEDLLNLQSSTLEIVEANTNKMLTETNGKEVALAKAENVATSSVKIALNFKQLVVLAFVIVFCVGFVGSIINDFVSGNLTLEYLLKTVGSFLAGAGAKAVIDLAK